MLKYCNHVNGRVVACNMSRRTWPGSCSYIVSKYDLDFGVWSSKCEWLYVLKLSNRRLIRTIVTVVSADVTLFDKLCVLNNFGLQGIVSGSSTFRRIVYNEEWLLVQKEIMYSESGGDLTRFWHSNQDFLFFTVSLAEMNGRLSIFPSGKSGKITRQTLHRNFIFFYKKSLANPETRLIYIS